MQKGVHTRHTDKQELAAFQPIIASPLVHPYFIMCLPTNVYSASGIRMLPLKWICEEAFELVPGARLFAYGYIPIATSIGGNAICVRADGQVFWADHDSWYDDYILFHNRETDEWIELSGYSPAHVEQALVPLANNFEQFLFALLNDELTKQLEELD
jgi:hypothetical protein